MTTKTKILVINSDRIFLNKIKQQLPPDYTLVISSDLAEAELLQHTRDIEIIISLSVSTKLIVSAPKLKMIQSIGSGVDGIDIDTATEKGIIVCSTTGLNAVPTAEHAMSLILALAKNIRKYDAEIRRKRWQSISHSVSMLNKKTLGIVGLGSIGVEVAKRAQAFGMKILAIKRLPSEELRKKLNIEFLGGPDDLHRILKESDFILLSLVLTPETEKMIGEKELRMMKPSAYLVNISRGKVIDEAALIKVLSAKLIAGAGLDVFVDEPIKTESSILKLKNTILTPHIAGGAWADEIRDKRAKFIVRNIQRVSEGKKPDKIVDPKLKYVIENS